MNNKPSSLGSQSDTSANLTESQLVDLCHRTLHYHGFSDDQVAALTETLVAAEMDGCRSHGIYRLLVIIDTLRKGCVKPDAVPVVEDMAPGVVKVDAQGGLSPSPSTKVLSCFKRKPATQASPFWQSITAYMLRLFGSRSKNLPNEG